MPSDEEPRSRSCPGFFRHAVHSVPGVRHAGGTTELAPALNVPSVPPVRLNFDKVRARSGAAASSPPVGSGSLTRPLFVDDTSGTSGTLNSDAGFTVPPSQIAGGTGGTNREFGYRMPALTAVEPGRCGGGCGGVRCHPCRPAGFARRLTSTHRADPRLRCRLDAARSDLWPMGWHHR